MPTISNRLVAAPRRRGSLPIRPESSRSSQSLQVSSCSQVHSSQFTGLSLSLSLSRKSQGLPIRSLAGGAGRFEVRSSQVDSHRLKSLGLPNQSPGGRPTSESRRTARGRPHRAPSARGSLPPRALMGRPKSQWKFFFMLVEGFTHAHHRMRTFVGPVESEP